LQLNIQFEGLSVTLAGYFCWQIFNDYYNLSVKNNLEVRLHVLCLQVLNDMSKEKHNIPKQLRLGKTGKSQEAKLPKGTSPGRINIDLPEINWTPSKLTITIALLCLPYFIAVVASFLVGNNLIGFLFIGLGFLVIGIYFLLRYIERSDF